MELAPEVEQQLADMSDEDWRALSVRVRPPIGAAGAAEAARRFGPSIPPLDHRATSNGGGGRAEAEKRYGTKGDVK